MTSDNTPEEILVATITLRAHKGDELTGSVVLQFDGDTSMSPAALLAVHAAARAAQEAWQYGLREHSAPTPDDQTSQLATEMPDASE